MYVLSVGVHPWKDLMFCKTVDAPAPTNILSVSKSWALSNYMHAGYTRLKLFLVRNGINATGPGYGAPLILDEERKVHQTSTILITLDNSHLYGVNSMQFP